MKKQALRKKVTFTTRNSSFSSQKICKKKKTPKRYSIFSLTANCCCGYGLLRTKASVRALAGLFIKNTRTLALTASCCRAHTPLRTKANLRTLAGPLLKIQIALHNGKLYNTVWIEKMLCKRNECSLWIVKRCVTEYNTLRKKKTICQVQTLSGLKTLNRERVQYSHLGIKNNHLSRVQYSDRFPSYNSYRYRLWLLKF